MSGVDQRSLRERAERAVERLEEADRALHAAGEMLRGLLPPPDMVQAVAREIDRASTTLEDARQELLQIRKAAEVVEQALSEGRL